jgi:ribosome-associated protein
VTAPSGARGPASGHSFFSSFVRESQRRCIIAGIDPSTSATATASATQHDRAQATRTFAIEAARLAANTRCHNVVVLDVRGISPITDYFVLATGSSARQMRTVMEELQELGQTRGFAALSKCSYESENWLLCDMVDVVIHVFSQDARMFYDLDSLWGDAKRVEWKD